MPVIFEIGYLNLSNEVKKQSNFCWKFSDFRGFCVRMLRVRGIVNFVRHVSTIFRPDKSDWATRIFSATSHTPAHPRRRWIMRESILSNVLGKKNMN